MRKAISEAVTGNNEEQAEVGELLRLTLRVVEIPTTGPTLLLYTNVIWEVLPSKSSNHSFLYQKLSGGVIGQIISHPLCQVVSKVPSVLILNEL